VQAQVLDILSPSILGVWPIQAPRHPQMIETIIRERSIRLGDNPVVIGRFALNIKEDLQWNEIESFSIGQLIMFPLQSFRCGIKCLQPFD